MSLFIKYKVLLSVLAIFCLWLVLPVFAASAELSLAAGYRADSLDWTIASDFAGSTPNILSELTWDDLTIFELSASAEIARELQQDRDAVFFGKSAYGWVLSGKNRDSDYAGDNRTVEWSRSNNDASEGRVFDLEGGVGLRVTLPDRQWSLMPNLGYGYNEQYLVMQDGQQTFSLIPAPAPFLDPPQVGPFPGLDSSYLAWWYGPWLGLETRYRPDAISSWQLSLRWHKIDFRAEANWNLRTDLRHPVSFEQEASGDGLSLEAGYDRRLDDQWRVGGRLAYTDFQASDGMDVVYLAGGGAAGTRLNEVNWQSWSASITLMYAY